MTLIKDSGERQQFETGAVRDCQAGKGRFDLIQPAFLWEVAKVNEAGAGKYGARNYENGIPLGRYLDSAMRHLLKWALGYRDEPHLAQVAWNVEKLWWTEAEIAAGRLPASLDDGGYRELAARMGDGLDSSDSSYCSNESPAPPEEDSQEEVPDRPALAAARAFFNQGPGEVADYYTYMTARGFHSLDAWRARRDLGTVSWLFFGRSWLGLREDAPSGAEVTDSQGTPVAPEPDPKEKALRAARILLAGPRVLTDYYQDMLAQGFTNTQAFDARVGVGARRWVQGGLVHIGLPEFAPAGVEVRP